MSSLRGVSTFPNVFHCLQVPSIPAKRANSFPQVKALRRQQKPMSGKLGEQRNQTMSSTRELNGIETSSHDFNYNTSHVVTSSTSLSSLSSTSRFSGGAGRPSGLPVKSPRKKKTMEQASRSAKKKWDVIDKKVR